MTHQHETLPVYNDAINELKTSLINVDKEGKITLTESGEQLVR
jgi:Mn-dependent DtxR family transcriptional regulator